MVAPETAEVGSVAHGELTPMSMGYLIPGPELFPGVVVIGVAIGAVIVASKRVRRSRPRRHRR